MRYRLALAFCLVLLAPGIALAQLSGPVTIVVPYPPGGPFDIFARLIQPKLSQGIGQPIVIDNRGGANGNIGADHVAKATPNGRTLLLIGSPHAINASLYKTLSYDVARDLVPVATISRSAFLLLVHSAVPANSVKELIALAKAKPNALNYGSGGSGSVGHLAAAMLNAMAGTQMVHVPYKGAGPALNDTLAGHINVYFNTIIASLQHLKGGKIRGLAVTSEKRSPLLPELPTIAESGLPGYEATSWFGLAAPAGTPRDMIARLNAEVEKAVKDPEIQQKIQAQGADPLVMSADQFGALLKADITKWAKVVKDSGATVE